ncbi:MAG: hypothetical protein HOV87_02760 [Catenulispora sp.]|nr:hypothetical protein [Catenulispora sp.]
MRGIRAALIAAALLAAGCSSSGSSGGGSGGVPKTLAAALHGVHATDDTKVSVAWGVYGGGNASVFYDALTPILGFGVLHQPFVLTVGLPPKSVSVLYGSFDPAAIGAKLQGLGYTRSDRGAGVTQWLVRDDHQLDPNQKPDELAQAGDTFNVIRVSKDRVVYGGATADLDAALPARSASLADDPVVGEIAKCMDQEDSGDYDSSGGYQIAVGAGSGDTETICVAAPDDATAKRYGDAFTKAVTSGTSEVSLARWSTEFSAPKVESLGGKAHVMRLTVTDVNTSHPHVLPNLLFDTSLLNLIGEHSAKARPTPGPSSGSSPSDDASSSSSS